MCPRSEVGQVTEVLRSIGRRAGAATHGIAHGELRRRPRACRSRGYRHVHPEADLHLCVAHMLSVV